jgi:hypothetical protein
LGHLGHIRDRAMTGTVGALVGAVGAAAAGTMSAWAGVYEGAGSAVAAWAPAGATSPKVQSSKSCTPQYGEARGEREIEDDDGNVDGPAVLDSIWVRSVEGPAIPEREYDCSLRALLLVLQSRI